MKLFLSALALYPPSQYISRYYLLYIVIAYKVITYNQYIVYRYKGVNRLKKIDSPHINGVGVSENKHAAT